VLTITDNTDTTDELQRQHLVPAYSSIIDGSRYLLNSICESSIYNNSTITQVAVYSELMNLTHMHVCADAVYSAWKRRKSGPRLERLGCFGYCPEALPHKPSGAAECQLSALNVNIGYEHICIGAEDQNKIASGAAGWNRDNKAARPP
jgi:hypothetical protein